MIFKLRFKTAALTEWRSLDAHVRAQFKKKLEKRLVQPHVPSTKLSVMKNSYKIKLRSSGFRLVYIVRDKELIVSVVAVGKRDKYKVYRQDLKRLQNE